MEKVVVNNLEELINYLEDNNIINKNEPLNILTSPINREYNIEITYIPDCIEEFDIITKTYPREILHKMGCSVWEEYYGGKITNDNSYLKLNDVHYLFPIEWYDNIPHGYKMVDIFGDKTTFSKEQCNNDSRFGCLSYGFVRNEPKNKEL